MHQDAQGNYRSQIVIDTHVEEAISQIVKTIGAHICHTFYSEEFLLAHAKEAIKQAYIAQHEIHYILIGTMKLSEVVQNSLLKILEEPPKNMRFIVVVPSKSILLPTILSRLPLQKNSTHQKAQLDITIDVQYLDTQQVYEILKQTRRISRGEARLLIEDVLNQAVKLGIPLSQEQLTQFEEATSLLELNANPQSVLLNVLLLVARM